METISQQNRVRTLRITDINNFEKNNESFDVVSKQKNLLLTIYMISKSHFYRIANINSRYLQSQFLYSHTTHNLKYMFTFFNAKIALQMSETMMMHISIGVSNYTIRKSIKSSCRLLCLNVSSSVMLMNYSVYFIPIMHDYGIILIKDLFMIEISEKERK